VTCDVGKRAGNSDTAIVNKFGGAAKWTALIMFTDAAKKESHS
jgi:hypothetical protein